MLAVFSMTIATIVLVIEGVLGGGGGGGRGPPPKHKEGLLDRLADALKSLAGKVAEELPAMIGNVVGGALSFLGKTVGFAAKHIWALIVFIPGLIAVWLMQRARGR